MSPRRRLVVAVALALVAFVVVATGHGRQLRLEREAHGYLQMDPEQGWPQPMHEVWLADRARLKVGSAVAAIVVAGVAVAAGRGVGSGVLGVLVWGPSLGFVVAAIFSQVRLRAFDAAAANAALPAPLLMSLVALAMLVASAFFARKRPTSIQT